MCIDGFDEAPDGGFTGCLVEIRCFVFSTSQSFEHVLGTCIAPLSDGIKTPGPAHEGTDGDGEDSQPVVAYPPCHAALRDGQKGLVEEIGVVFREFHGGQPRF